MAYAVITSKDNLKVPVKRARVIVKDNCIEWLFASEKEAQKATLAFINAGFSSVGRK